MASRKRRIAVLTSGGDAPGMNAAIRAVVRVSASHDVETLGVRGGYQGLMDGDMIPLGPRSVAHIILRGGTMLGSSRAPAFRTPEGQQRALDQLAARGVDGLVVIGGNGSQSGGNALHLLGYPTVGIASTIDNDIAGVDTSIGVDTALNTALEMVDRLRDTATSHRRAFAVEVMGRNSGYLALMTGIAAGAGLILTPEFPVDLAQAEQALRDAYASGKSHFLAVVAEGSPLKAAELVQHLSQIRGGAYETRLSVLGHVQRGGPPLAFDRLLATRSAAIAVEALLRGETGVVGGLADGRYHLIPITDAIRPVSKVTPELCELAAVLAR
jgi:6-phosphofructokinase 1